MPCPGSHFGHLPCPRNTVRTRSRWVSRTPSRPPRHCVRLLGSHPLSLTRDEWLLALTGPPVLAWGEGCWEAERMMFTGRFPSQAHHPSHASDHDGAEGATWRSWFLKLTQMTSAPSKVCASGKTSLQTPQKALSPETWLIRSKSCSRAT